MDSKYSQKVRYEYMALIYDQNVQLKNTFQKNSLKTGLDLRPSYTALM
jgi:hypothetical protein